MDNKCDFGEEKIVLTLVSNLNDILKFQYSSHLYLNIRNSIMPTDKEVFNLFLKVTVTY